MSLIDVLTDAFVAVGNEIRDHTHVVADLSNASTLAKTILTRTTGAQIRSDIGAGTSDLALGTTGSTAKAGNYAPAAADISDSTTVGRNVLKAADGATARSAIGAGTSSLALGSTSSTAAAGDHTHTAAAVGAADVEGSAVGIWLGTVASLPGTGTTGYIYFTY